MNNCDAIRTALRDLIDAIPEQTLKADPPLECWVQMAEAALQLGDSDEMREVPVVAGLGAGDNRHPDEHVLKTACHLCFGAGELVGLTTMRCPRCQGSGREIADLAGIDRIGGTHGGER